MRSFVDLVLSTRPTLYLPSAAGRGSAKDYAYRGNLWTHTGAQLAAKGGVPGAPEHRGAKWPGGSSIRMEMIGDASFNVDQGVTWMTWFIRTSGSSQYQQFMDRDEGPSNQRVWQWRMDNGKPQVIIQASSGTHSVTNSTAAPVDDQWHMAAARYRDDNYVDTWLDGIRGGGPAGAYGTLNQYGTPTDIWIGDFIGSPNGIQEFQSIAAHHAFWTRTLADDELRVLWRSGRAASRRSADPLLLGV